MGIQDRDYYRRHDRKVVSITSKRTPSHGLRIALFWIAIGALIFVAIRFLSRPPPVSRATPQPAAQPAVRNEPARTVATPPVVQSPPPSPSSAGPSSTTPIYRCGNSYGHSPCDGGRLVEGPASSGFESRPSRAYVDLVARGRSPTVDTATNTVTSTTTTTIMTVNAGGGRDGVVMVECKALADEIAYIDRAARQPRSIPQQDRYREQRRRASDRRAALHC